MDVMRASSLVMQELTQALHLGETLGTEPFTEEHRWCLAQILTWEILLHFFQNAPDEVSDITQALPPGGDPGDRALHRGAPLVSGTDTDLGNTAPLLPECPRWGKWYDSAPGGDPWDRALHRGAPLVSGTDTDLGNTAPLLPECSRWGKWYDSAPGGDPWDRALHRGAPLVSGTDTDLEYNAPLLSECPRWGKWYDSAPGGDPWDRALHRGAPLVSGTDTDLEYNAPLLSECSRWGILQWVFVYCDNNMSYWVISAWKKLITWLEISLVDFMFQHIAGCICVLLKLAILTPRILELEMILDAEWLDKKSGEGNKASISHLCWYM